MQRFIFLAIIILISIFPNFTSRVTNNTVLYGSRKCCHYRTTIHQTLTWKINKTALNNQHSLLPSLNTFTSSNRTNIDADNTLCVHLNTKTLIVYQNRIKQTINAQKGRFITCGVFCGLARVPVDKVQVGGSQSKSFRSMFAPHNRRNRRVIPAVKCCARVYWLHNIVFLYGRHVASVRIELWGAYFGGEILFYFGHIFIISLIGNPLYTFTRVFVANSWLKSDQKFSKYSAWMEPEM